MMTDKEKKNYLLIAGITLISVIILFILFTTSQSETKEVKLYFSYNQGQNLKSEVRRVESDQLYVNTIQELIQGPTDKYLGQTLPDGTKLIDFKLRKEVLILNFNSKFRENHWGGSTGEIMTIYSIVNTMAQFPEVKQVQFLIAGTKIESLVGHIDLTDPIGPNDELIEYEN
ncbi:GerMN domain-containing protein [Acetohalobium arabaticum]|uniref:Lipoprotein LpqB, GerMN domain protein n=1 Tax=Acetohalobium arabaticum (strain ATCC 49924 / DSM 5501 / Z-7288) TaxID=574087 RepID=D9QS21_ACEAZ|nr:GerMN domain-containing protein [Acetohalobium arabaticum]ADL13312.1 Lipoprotein LpqB, GerMN domain protein [Acetohalobium arabaticum DSM 5501]